MVNLWDGSVMSKCLQGLCYNEVFCQFVDVSFPEEPVGLHHLSCQDILHHRLCQSVQARDVKSEVKGQSREKKTDLCKKADSFLVFRLMTKKGTPRLRHALHSKVAPLLRDFTWASPWLFISLKFVNTQNHSGLYVIKLKRLDRNGLTLESKLLKKGNRVKTIYRTFYIARDD